MMALMILVPMAALGGLATVQVVQVNQKAFKDRLYATARLLGATLDSEIRTRAAIIAALSEAPSASGLNAADVAAYVDRVGGGPRTLLVTDARAAPDRLSWIEDDTAPYHVTDIMRGAPGAPLFAAVLGPVRNRGQVIATVAMPFLADDLDRLLAAGSVSGGGFALLLDGCGRIVAAAGVAGAVVGARAPAWMMASDNRKPGVVTGKIGDARGNRDAMIAAAVHPADAAAWTVVAGQPLGRYRSEWVSPLAELGGGGLVLLACLLLLVDRFSIWLAGPLKALTRSARMTVQDRERVPDAELMSRVAEFETLRVGLKEAAQVMDGRAEAIGVAFASARRERNLLHSVVNGTSDPTFVRDKEGRLVLVNTAGLALLGQPAATVIGHISPEPGASASALSRAEDMQVFVSGQPMAIERTIVIDNERRTFVGTKSPWRSASGDPLGVVMIVHDITEWKRSEDRLRNIQAELIRTGRLSAMGAMANGLAHELNQPLAAITNFLGAARRLIARASANDSGRVGATYGALDVASGAIEDACTQALRAGEIVSRLRDFIGRGVASMRIENIGALIADACALAMPQDTRGRVALHLSVAAELEPVFVDRLQIQQVLVNLVQSMAESKRQELTIVAARDAVGDTCITLSDTGPGIPETMMSEIFEPFVSTRNDSLGMGLAIARMIAAAHGGTLSACNNRDGGATLTLVLPAVLSMEGVDA
jgi:two-component system sensor kinase FixL